MLSSRNVNTASRPVKPGKMLVIDTKEVDVPMTPGKQEDKQIPVTLSQAVLQRGSGGIRGGKLREISGRVLQTTAVTSSANTAQAGVVKLTPQSATEFASYLSLYDEAKVSSIDVWYNVSANGGTIPTSTDWGLAFDPINNGAYTSAPGVLLASQHQFGKMTAGIGASTAACPLPVNEKGVFHWHIAVPKGATALTNATDGPLFVGGQWFETGDSDTTAIVGYVKTYIPAMGSGIMSTVDLHIVYNCRFRSRT